MLSLVLLFSILFHSFHVSVTQIKYDEEESTLQISIRMFLDDLELGLREYTQKDDLDITASASKEFVADELEKYVLERVHFWDEKEKPYELNYIGSEVDGDVMWCYVEIEKVKRLKMIKVSNSLLLEVWNDQENIVHFRALGKVRSARLFKGQETVTIDWDTKFNYFGW